MPETPRQNFRGLLQETLSGSQLHLTDSCLHASARRQWCAWRHRVPCECAARVRHGPEPWLHARLQCKQDRQKESEAGFPLESCALAIGSPRECRQTPRESLLYQVKPQASVLAARTFRSACASTYFSASRSN